MATTEFGDEAIEVQTTVATEFGDPAVAAAPTINTIVPSATNPQGFTPEQQVIANRFISQAQRSPLTKAIEGAIGLGSAVLSPLGSIARGIGEIPTVVQTPSQLLPTAGEAGRRVGIDILNLGRMASREIPTLAAGPLAATKLVYDALANLASRTPTQEEIAQAVAAAPFEEALAAERQNVAFEGANPELSEALTQAVELAPPLKAAQLAIRGTSVAKASVPRIFRTAIKPQRQFAGRVESALEANQADIFYANPNADKLGQMPLEGFTQTVSDVKRQVASQINDGLVAAGTPINAGDEMAAALNRRADELARAGQPAETVNALASRAEALRGQVTDMESLREATTLANRANSPLFQRTREAANPLRAQADTMANEIIARIGGDIQNKALESVRGPEGAALRKKWSDLTLIEQESSKQLNKLINSAPPEIQSALASSLTSLEGAAGLVGLVQGYAAGIIPVVTSAAKSWAKRSNKLLKDSNALVTSAYDKLRANPPAPPSQIASQTPTPVATTPLPGTPFSTPVTTAVAAPAPTVSTTSTVVPTPVPQPAAMTLEQAISQAAAPIPESFPSRPSPGTARVIPSMDIRELYQQMLDLANQGRTVEAAILQEFIRNQMR